MIYLFITALAATVLGYATPIVNIVAPYFFYKSFAKNDFQTLTNNPFFYPLFLLTIWLLAVTFYFNNFLGLLAGIYAILPTVLLFFYASKQLDKNKALSFLQVLVSLSMLAAPVAFYQQYVLKVSIFERAYATFGNANFYASYLLLIIPSAVALAVYAKAKKMRLYYIIMALVNTYCLLLTNSRSSIIALIIAFIFFAVLGKNKRLLIMTGITASVLAILILINPELIPRYKIMGSELQERISIWSLGWYAVKQHPLIGSGLTSFYTQYVMNYPGKYAPHAHNLYLNIFVEGGIIALTLLFWSIFTVYYTGLKKLALSRNILVIGILSGITATLIQSLLDNPLENFQTGTIFALFVAILMRI